MTENTSYQHQQPDETLRLRRVPTGVPGLDAVLRGGLFAGGAYIINGSPGTGKTILANQICFQHIRAGGRALFVTLLAESHVRMLQHLATLSFYDPTLIPDQVYYISAFRTLEAEGLGGLMTLLRRELRAHGASLLVLDGMLSLTESAVSDRAFRKFVHELQAHLRTSDCVALLLTSDGRPPDSHAEHTMVDGLIMLEDVRLGNRTQRNLEVRKSRGSDALGGSHPYRITEAGIVLYPRIEALLSNPSRLEKSSTERTPLGVPELDAMMGGGPLSGTTTLILGISGAGKTTLGMHFLARSSATEPGLHFGFYEMPDQLLANAAGMGLDLAGLVGDGHLEVIWRPPSEQMLDDLGGQLIDAVHRRGVRRLFVDGLGGYLEAADRPERVSRFVTALANELRGEGVTTLYTGETQNLFGPEVRVPAEGISATVENLILLRCVELDVRLRRIISIMKVRGSSFDHRLREFRITESGIALRDVFDPAQLQVSQSGLRRPPRAPKRLPGG